MKAGFFSCLKFCLPLMLAGLILFGWLGGLRAYAGEQRSPDPPTVMINELDSDNPGADSYEFIELYDGGVGNTSLNGLVLVFYNGAAVPDKSYRAIDLDGYKTDERGYFVIGNPLVPGANITFAAGTLQNGADAVALYLGDASDFPNGTLITVSNLIDAVVYDTGQEDDPGLLALLNPGQPQVNENSRNSDLDSLQRCPDGSGGLRNTISYQVFLPTPGMPNCRPIIYKRAPLVVSGGERITYTITVGNIFPTPLENLVISDVIPADTVFAKAYDGGVFSNGQVIWNVPSLPPATPANPLQAQVKVRFEVIVTLPSGSALYNRLYAVKASNFVTPTYGPVVRSILADNITPIHDIQGAAHLSPKLGQGVRDVLGIITAVQNDGFYMQSPKPDSDIATSEGIYVQIGGPHALVVGDAVLVDGLVEEFRPGGQSGLANLTITRLIYPIVQKISSGNPIPEAVVIGAGGRMPPDLVIEDDALGNVETSGIFDPHLDGMDFYESLEGMLVFVNNPIAISPTDISVGENFILPDLGAGASGLTPRGGIALRPGDFNPERLIVDDVLLPVEPIVRTGTVFNGPLVGVMDYSRFNYKLLNITPFPSPSGGVISETTRLTSTAGSLRVATFNLENLDPFDPQSKFDRLAREIVENMGAPDLIAVEEIQDNSGTVNDGVVAADQTFLKLIEAIKSAGGPTYSFRNINPVNNQDGGEPGGNIRQGFLFRTDRGLSFIDRPGGTATTPNSVIRDGVSVHLEFSPGRIDPTNPAFLGSRKPLAGEFIFNGYKLFVIANHLNSKQGDDPLFGRFQPPNFATESKRIQQSQIVNNFVKAILKLDPQANILVLGDMNDFAFSASLQTLAGSELINLVATLPAEEQYTYLYEGNSQAIDHILISVGFNSRWEAEVDIVHVNAEFLDAERPTDHDPVLARFRLRSLNEKIFLPLVGR